MKLQQNQIWHKGSEYYRIVQLDRLEVFRNAGFAQSMNETIGQSRLHLAEKGK